MLALLIMVFFATTFQQQQHQRQQLETVRISFCLLCLARHVIIYGTKRIFSIMFLDLQYEATNLWHISAYFLVRMCCIGVFLC